jgi:hypothetical protein
MLVVININEKEDSVNNITTLIARTATSLLSGIFGMAGGMVLMFVLLSLYSVTSCHGPSWFSPAYC